MEAVRHSQSAPKEERIRAGQWLRAAREARGLSQRALAAAVGIDYYTFIAQVEAGRGRIPPERYEAWARALDIPPKEFVRRMLMYYEPSTYRILFGEEDQPADR